MYADKMLVRALSRVPEIADLRELTVEFERQFRAPQAKTALAYWKWMIGVGRPGKKLKRKGNLLSVAMWESFPRVAQKTKYPQWKRGRRLGRNIKMIFAALLERERNTLIAFLRQYVPSAINGTLVKGFGRFLGTRTLLLRARVSGYHTLHLTEPVRNYQALRDLMVTWILFCLEASSSLFGIPAVVYSSKRAISERFGKPLEIDWSPCVIWSGHDPATCMECRSWHTGKGERRPDLTWNATHCVRGHIVCESHHEPLVVYGQYRRKNAIDVVARLLVDKDPPVSDITEVPDYHGWRFLFEKDVDIDRFLAHPAVKKLLADCKNLPKDTRRSGSVNRFSSGVKLVSVKRKIPDVWLGGEEIQLMTVSDFLNAEYSTSAVGHELYKLRVHLEVTLPWLFPKQLFGVDWSAPEVRAKCEAHVKTRLRHGS